MAQPLRTGVQEALSVARGHTATQLTVSSQLPNPLSTPARVLDVLLQGWAISVVAMLAGAFGAFFHRRGIEHDPIEPRK